MTVETEKQPEEIIVTQQTSEKVEAPTAQIQTEEKQPEETISTTTTVEEQQKPSFQASSSVEQPEQLQQTTEEIIIIAETKKPTDQIIEVKTVAEEEPITTTTEVTEQVQPQVTTDASSTKPETDKKQVS